MKISTAKTLFYKLFDYSASTIENRRWKARAHMLALKYHCSINYVGQGPGGLEIQGNGIFRMAPTSHLKSNTFIECTGNVIIGDYFHVGRGLTIFSSNHNWKSHEYIPYGKESILKQVTIGSAVWVGSNVTILPGSTVGDGAIIGAGTVVRGTIPPGSIVIGNPSTIIGTRDMQIFRDLQSEAKFF